MGIKFFICPYSWPFNFKSEISWPSFWGINEIFMKFENNGHEIVQGAILYITNGH